MAFWEVYCFENAAIMSYTEDTLMAQLWFMLEDQDKNLWNTDIFPS